jgi:type I restriction enzyme S subunit
MIADLKPYPEYKESGQEWLGQVPAHWDLKPGHAAFDKRKIPNTGLKENTVLSLSYGKIKVKPTDKQHGLVPESYETYQIVDKGNIIIRGTDLQNDKTSLRIGLARNRGIISSAYLCLHCRDTVSPEYGYQILNTFDLTKAIYRYGSGLRQNLDQGEIKRLPIFLPPPSEQAAVVRFLDHWNGRLEKAIRSKRRVIALLQEQKQAIIHRAVTRGLDPNVKLKDSGIPWLGDIPQHWEVRRVKQVTQILRGKFTHRPRNDPSLYDGPFPFIQTGSVARAKKFITEYKQTLNERGLAVSKMFPKGTLCMTIAANIGDVAILDFEACFPDSIVGFVPQRYLDRDFLFFVFRCMKQELLADAPVNTQGNLNVERIGLKGIPYPALDEQQAIAKNIEAETGTFNTAIARTEREIALMQEYRTRLTADVVTGKLDVRAAAAKLPDVAEAAQDEPLEELETAMEETDDGNN